MDLPSGSRVRVLNPPDLPFEGFLVDRQPESIDRDNGRQTVRWECLICSRDRSPVWVPADAVQPA
ncbi:MAG TPA: hypothetical protein VKA89_00720 [Solirubrobacterales bacterium]|nr:hypothetical protein [Solirubrobacterales bacterium]